MSAPIQFIAIIYPTPEKADHLKSLSSKLFSKVQETEPGVLQYGMYTGKALEGGEVLVAHETYANQAAFEAHAETQMLKDFQKELAESCRQPPQLFSTEKFAGFVRQ